jgi:hypothetical protein
VDELLVALECCYNTSPGFDNIHNEMLSHLPSTSREFLLCICNHIWMKSVVPVAWR